MFIHISVILNEKENQIYKLRNEKITRVFEIKAEKEKSKNELDQAGSQSSVIL